MRIIAIKLDPDVFNARKYIDAVERGLDEVAKQASGDFDKIFDTWQHKPAVDIQKEKLSRTVGTDDQVAFYLNEGTSVRYATMTNPFGAKTEPMVIGSNPGIGGLNYVSRKHPRPGIKARHWDEAIAKKYENGLAVSIITNELNKLP